MYHLVNIASRARSYSSPLREENAERTRRRILDGLVQVLAESPAELSIPAVARRAGVSVPTVYRHFGSKRGLTDALYEHYTKRIGTDFEDVEIRSVETFLEHMPEIFRKQDEVDAGTRAAMSTEFAHRLRRKMMPQRLAAMDRALRGSGVRASDRARLRVLFTVFTSSAIQNAFRDYFEIGPDEAAEHIAWAMRTLLTAVTRRTPGKGKR
jgi:AcrR family transcriptional regulator